MKSNNVNKVCDYDNGIYTIYKKEGSEIKFVTDCYCHACKKQCKSVLAVIGSKCEDYPTLCQECINGIFTEGASRLEGIKMIKKDNIHYNKKNKTVVHTDPSNNSTYEMDCETSSVAQWMYHISDKVYFSLNDYLNTWDVFQMVKAAYPELPVFNGKEKEHIARRMGNKVLDRQYWKSIWQKSHEISSSEYEEVSFT